MCFVLLSLIIITGCTLRAKETANETTNDQVTVRVEEITNQPIEEVVRVWGVVHPSVEINLTTSFNSEVQQLYKKLGDTVTENETIALLKSEEAEAARIQAENNVLRAESAIQNSKQNAANEKYELQILVKKQKAQYDQLSKSLNKIKNDYDSGSVTIEQLNQAQLDVESSKIDLDLAKQRLAAVDNSIDLAMLEMELSNAKNELQQVEEAISLLEVKSPINGIVSNLALVDQGEVTTGATIAKIVQVNPVQIITQLNEDVVSLVNGKTELVYYLESDGIKEKAPIVYLANSMESSSSTYELRMEVANSNAKLVPGKQVVIQLSEEPNPVPPSIPLQSVISENNEHFAFVLVGDTVYKRKIELGQSNDFYTEVLNGLEVGEMLVISGQEELEDQQKVISELVER